MLIDFKFTGLGQATSDMNKAAQAASGLNTALKGGRASGGSGGPLSDVTAAMKRFQTAQSTGVGVFDAQVNLLRKQSALQRAMSQVNAGPFDKFAKSLTGIVYSTRVGVGSGGLQVMPLIGKVVGSIGELGPEMLALAAALAILAAAAAITVTVIEAGMKYGVAFGQAQFSGGGSAAATAQLGAFGAMAGMGIGQISGLGKSYNQYLMTNPLGAAAAQGRGQGPNYVGAFGNIDDTDRLIDGLRNILFNPSTEAVRRQNYGGPLEQFEWMRNASPDVKNKFFQQEQFEQSPEQLQRTANAQIELNIALANLSQVAVKLSEGVDWDAVNTGLSLVGDALKDIAIAAPSAANAIENLASAAARQIPVIGGFLGNLMDSINALFGHGSDSSAKAQADAQNRHTDAMYNHARALDNARNVYNGGPNARGAVGNGYFVPGGGGAQGQDLGQIPLG